MNAPDKMIISASRRNWLKAAGALAGFTLVAGPSGLVMAADAVKYGGENMAGGVVDDALVFLSIGADGVVTIVSHRSEMGQGIRTSLPMVAADELGADWGKVKVQQAPADEARYGSQDTDGSRSMRHSFRAMRHVGATARLMLETAAAARWHVPVGEVKAIDHQVVHAASARALGFGVLCSRAVADMICPA